MNRGLALASVAAWTAVVFSVGWAARGSSGPSPAPANTPAPSAATTDAINAASLAARGTTGLLDEAWARVRESFVGQIPTDQQRDYAAIRGSLTALNDRYTVFVEPRSRSAERDHYAGRFGGIGVSLVPGADGQIVLRPVRGSPAERSGLRDGDVLVALDGLEIGEKPDFTDVATRIRGDPGTTLLLAIRRAQQRLTFSVTRELIDVPSVDYRVIDTPALKGRPVGFVAVHTFTERTGLEFRRAITEMLASGATAWIVDLRDNGGGLLSAAQDVASQFLSEGNVLVEHNRSGDTAWPVTRGGLLTNPSIAVLILVNGRTASAAEIVAGALQDFRRATVLGEHTYGKGSVQLLYDLRDGSSVHVTSARWYTPNRRTIEGVGILPDVEVVGQAQDAASGVDAQLERAIKMMSDRQ